MTDYVFVVLTSLVEVKNPKDEKVPYPWFFYVVYFSVLIVHLIASVRVDNSNYATISKKDVSTEEKDTLFPNYFLFQLVYSV